MKIISIFCNDGTFRCYRKLILIMRITFLLLTINLLTIHAVSYTQSSKVSINLKEAAIKEILSSIEEQTDYKFLYSDDFIENQFVSVRVKNLSVADVLEMVLKETGNSFREIENNLIVVAPFVGESNNQQLTIKGKVTDINEAPLPGANVIEKGTSNGTITDADGNFTIIVTSPDAILSFSFIGYNTEEVEVGDRSSINVKMVPSIEALEEIVVVGYGTLRKSDLVSSVAKVEVDKATSVPTVNIAEMLRGQAAGVQVNVGSLRPGGTSDIVIRGKSSIEGNNAPIFILDGVPVDNIDDVNPSDIVSMEVLKDASAQAIYGSKANNGVILITTKRGKEGKVQISYNAYTTVQSISRNFDVYNGQEFAQLRREAYRTDNANDEYENDDFVFEPGELEAIQNNSFVNWEDEVLRDASIYSQSLSLSAGNESTKVYASLGHFKHNGIIPSSSFNRGTFRLNLDQKINKRLSTTFNVALISSDQDKESQSYNLITIPPLSKAYNDDGSLVRYPSGSPSYTSPLWNIKESTNDIKSNGYNFNFVTNYNITDNFSYKLNTSFNRKEDNEGKYLSSLHSVGRDYEGFAEVGKVFREYYLIENIFSYVKEINNNNKIDVTFVQSVDEEKYEETTTQGAGFVNESLGYEGISAALSPLPIQRFAYMKRSASFMGRIRYNLMNKYLLNATMRADGASVNSADNKWTYNPAVAFAWKINEEDFLKDIAVIDQLKFRVSYGSLANRAKDAYTSLSTAGDALYVFNGESQSGYLPVNALPNPNLTWETSTTFNVGLDFIVLNNIFNGSIEYYNTSTTDLLLTRSVNPITGYDRTLTNAGEVRNKGLELLLTANIINRNDLRWSITTTFANNDNEIIDLYGNDQNGDPINDEGRGYFVGQPTSTIRAYKVDGIWQEGEDFASSPQAEAGQANLGPGSIRVVDVNDDGTIDSDDRIFINPNPDWFGSVSTNIYFKNFELLADLYVVEGVKKANPYLSDFNSGGTLQGVLNGIKVPYYTPENPSTTYPRPRRSAQDSYLYDLSIQDASYIRLRTLSLGYTIPESVIGKLRVGSVKLYATATNLFTITDYKSYSPEINPNEYPDAKGFTFGLKVNF